MSRFDSEALLRTLCISRLRTPACGERSHFGKDLDRVVRTELPHLDIQWMKIVFIERVVKLLALKQGNQISQIHCQCSGRLFIEKYNI